MLGAVAPDAVCPRRGGRTGALRWSLLPAGDPDLDAVLAELVDCLFRSGRAPEATDIAAGVLGRPHDPRVDRRLRFALIGALSLQRRSSELIAEADLVLGDASEMTLAERAHTFGLKSL